MKLFKILALVAVLFSVACVQLPTSEQNVVDQRPGIAFTASAAINADVLVDGQVAGKVGDYLSGQAYLRVLPGTHHIQVQENGVMLLDERVYVGVGVNKTLRVN